MKALASMLVLIAIFFAVITSSVCADTLIYDNSDLTDYIFQPNSTYTEFIDYGISPGGRVSKFSFDYYTGGYSAGTIWVGFYQYTDYYDPGIEIKRFALTSVPPSNPSYFSRYEYIIPEEQRFELPSGDFGYSFEFSSYSTYAAVATGGQGNEDWIWVYDEWYYDFILSYIPGTWAGISMQVYTAPPIDEVTCDMSGYKFNDINGNGIWDVGEAALQGWEFYLDTNGNGTHEVSEPNVVTDPNGFYIFENIASPATYRIREITKDGWNQTLPGSSAGYQYVIATEPNNAYGPFNFGNTDQVINEITISGYIKEGTTALENVYVEAYQNGDTPTGRIDYTDAQGYYNIQLPSPWTGRLVVQKKGYLFDTTTYYSGCVTDITENINGIFLYGGGDGTQSTPFEIWTAAQMNNIGLNPFDWDQHFILMANIDLGIYAGATYAMIGVDQNEYFSGVFEGNNHVISNFTYSTSADVHTIAIFRAVRGVDAAIRNLTLGNPQITANQSWDVAPLVGYLYQGTISNCHVIGGQASGMWFVGGLAADNYYFDSSHGGILENCSSSCDVTGFAASQTYVGGLVAQNSGLIRNCYAAGNVSGSTYLGGLAGGISQNIIPSESGAIYDSYATGRVTGTQKVGGLIGYNSGAVVTDCYSTGLVSGTTEVGGLCGKNRTDGIVLGQFHNCFWDKETSNQNNSDGGTGLMTVDMQDKQTFLDAGWDFEGETANGTEDLWQICPVWGYPRLSWETINCSGTQIILYPVADAYVKSTEPDTNFGSSTSLMAGKSSTTIYRSFLKFDTSEIPDGYRIVSAKLELQANVVPFVDVEVGAWQTSESWTESGITWNNQRSPYDTSPADTCIISTENNSWDVTQDADDTYCYDRELSILLQSTNETLAYYAGFWSREITGSNVPRLVVTYVPVLGGGKGTADDPFQIWTAEQMNTIGLLSNRWDQSYKLMSDISMADYTGTLYNQIGKWSSTVSLRVPFKGVFDGNGYTISNFQAGALFDYVNVGRIQNLGLIAPVISDNGAIADHMEWSDIADCWVNGGSVSGSSLVGGLVGSFYISNMGGCWSSATVSGTNDVGGLVGQSPGLGHIQNCYAAGNVSGQSRVGGFIGTAYDSTIIDCYSRGTVTGTTDAGGFCGLAEHYYFTQDIAHDCFWDSLTSGKTTSALGTSKTTAQMKTLSTFTDAGWDFVSETTNGRNDDWALPADSYPVLCYQLATPPALPSFAGGSGTEATPYLIATVDHLNSIGHNRRLMDKHFRLINNLDLAGQSFTMIADGAYAFMGTFDGNSHVIKNISLSFPMYHSNIGFVGSNCGGRILNLTLLNADIQASYTHNVGSLVGLNRTGHIQNCHSQNLDVTGFWTVGGLVGGNYWHATISECSVIGRVEESTAISIIWSGVGGLVGENSWWSTIESSGANIAVLGEETVGGLVGNNIIFAQLTDCYAIGTVTATDDYAGGLTGRNGGTNMYTRCYAACKIAVPVDATRAGVLAGYETGGTYTDCFWDNQINGGLPAFGYTSASTVLIDSVGETTANMQMASTYQAQNWDFETVWRICEGTNYPRLQSEPKLPGDFSCPDGVGAEDFAQLAKCWQAATELQADISGDDRVNLADVAGLGTWWLNTNCGACGGRDFTGDGNVDMADLDIMINEWLRALIPACSIAELNGDKIIDIQDLRIFCDNWLLQR